MSTKVERKKIQHLFRMTGKQARRQLRWMRRHSPRALHLILDL